MMKKLTKHIFTKQKDHWLEQWLRVYRWHSKVKEIEKKLCMKNSINEDDKDIIFAFFQNCYYLRDWIKYSKPELQAKLEELFKTSIELQICQDICNGTKHLVLKKPKIDSNFDVYSYKDKIMIRSGKHNYDTFDLMKKLIEHWKGFIKREFIKNNKII